MRNFKLEILSLINFSIISCFSIFFSVAMIAVSSWFLLSCDKYGCHGNCLSEEWLESWNPFLEIFTSAGEVIRFAAIASRLRFFFFFFATILQSKIKKIIITHIKIINILTYIWIGCEVAFWLLGIWFIEWYKYLIKPNLAKPNLI